MKTKINTVVGNIYGNLKVISQPFSKYVPAKGKLYARKLIKCECLCENHTIFDVDEWKVTKGKISHCGCLTKHKTKYNPKVGDVYNGIEVMQKPYKVQETIPSGKIIHKIMLNCRCHCGNIFDIEQSKLCSLRTKSCENCPPKRTRIVKIGEKYDRFEVISEEFKDKHGLYNARCKCLKCDGEKNYRVYEILDLTTSCECSRKQKPHKEVNINDKFGHLTVISEPFKNKDMWEVRCKCDCTNEKDIIIYSLLNGGTQSCGCYDGKKNDIKKGDVFGELKVISDPFRKKVHEGKKDSNRLYVQCLCKHGVLYDIQTKALNRNRKGCSCYKKKEAVNIGDRFGHLEVIGDLKPVPTKYGKKIVNLLLYSCKCDCGNTVNLSGKELKIDKRTVCNQNKCEIFKKEKREKYPPKSYHPLYKKWIGMRCRCNHKVRNEKWATYYDKGIKVCTEWDKDFFVFKDFCLKNGWKSGLVIDRINSDLHYSPDNVRFVTRSQNSKNIVASRNEIIAKIEQELLMKNKKILELESRLQEYQCNKN